MTPTEEFGQLRLKFTDPIQDGYEIIRPIVLFDETVSERSRQTGLERRRIGEKAKSFVRYDLWFCKKEQKTWQYVKRVFIWRKVCTTQKPETRKPVILDRKWDIEKPEKDTELVLEQKNE